jgi:hypothetical protein
VVKGLDEMRSVNWVIVTVLGACNLDSTLREPDAALPSDAMPDMPPDSDGPMEVFGFHDYVKASNTAGSDLFGTSVALSKDGTTLVVGAQFEDSNTGINGDEGAAGSNEGAVYVYVRDGASWRKDAFLKASTRSAADQLGTIVGVSDDGNTIVASAIGEDSNGIGGQTDNSASGAGAAYVFVRSGTSWVQQAYLKASNPSAGDQFGTSLAISGDGNTIAVGATDERSLSTGINSIPNTSGTDAGAVYVFVRNGITWTQQAYVKPTVIESFDAFGVSVSLSADGATLAVGVQNEASGSAGNGPLDPNDNSKQGAGAVCVFGRSGMQWSQQAFLKATNPDLDDAFGRTVALSGDGSTLAVGAINEASGSAGVGANQSDNSAAKSGAVYVLSRNGNSWTHDEYLKATNPDQDDIFGFSLSISSDGSMVLVGAPAEDSASVLLDGIQGDNAADQTGAAYLFRRTNGDWQQQHYLKASNTEAGDEFGRVAISGDGRTVSISAAREGSSATLIDGDQTNNDAPLSGAVYVFRHAPEM